MNHYSPTLEQLIQARMASGRYASEDELLIDAIRALDDEDEELRALEEGLKDVDSGDEGTELHQAFAELRARNNLPPRS